MDNIREVIRAKAVSLAQSQTTLQCVGSAANVPEFSVIFPTLTVVRRTGITQSHYLKQEAQLMLTTGSTRLAVNQGQQT